MRSESRGLNRINVFFLIYITMLCATNTVRVATMAIGLQLTFINDTNYPGGIYVFLNGEFGLPSNIVNQVSYVVVNILADRYLVHVLIIIDW